MLVVSGQVKRETLVASYDDPRLRQLGDQEIDIIAMARGITKYAVMVTDPASIRYHLERALHLTTHGRPGPCWLDIPIDVQAAQIEPDGLRGYDPAEDDPGWALDDLPARCAEIVRRLRDAKRPVILLGTGLRLAGRGSDFETVSRKIGAPVAPAWTGIDLVRPTTRSFAGGPGTIGDRAGNFAVQNADVLLVIGSRLNIRQVSYNWQSFARHAFKIQVDVDRSELHKPTVRPDLGITATRGCFSRNWIDSSTPPARSRAPRRVGGLVPGTRRALPRGRARHRVVKNGLVNPYHFMEKALRPPRRRRHRRLRQCDGERGRVPGGARRSGQRIFANSGCAAMGFDLPAAIGAADRRGRPASSAWPATAASS